MPADEVLARFAHGPLNGKTLVLPVATYGWPLPERLAVLAHLQHVEKIALWDADDPDGSGLPELILDSPNKAVYVKLNESKLPARAVQSPQVMRGADYGLMEG